MSFVYLRSESTLWTVGFYDPSGRWHSESDHGSKDEAAARCAWLNGREPAPVAADVATEAAA